MKLILRLNNQTIQISAQFSPNCLTCTNTSYCNSCGTGFALTSSENTRNCQESRNTLPRCICCISTIVCSTCNFTEDYVLSGSSCGCASWYFLNSSSKCEACTSWSPQCTTCTSSASSGCSANYIIDGTGCKQNCNITGSNTC